MRAFCLYLAIPIAIWLLGIVSNALVEKAMVKRGCSRFFIHFIGIIFTIIIGFALAGYFLAIITHRIRA